MIKNKLEKILLRVQKPGRYTAGEPGSVIKNKNDIKVRFAFCFPDTYEIGMSHLGMKILYSQFNEKPYIWCERVFAPWIDMEDEMRNNNIPLFALESKDPIKDFDFIGFTLQYELSYTNILNILNLAGIELQAKNRKSLNQIVVAGGPCACNPEPLADFIDLFFIGEGEEVDLEVIDLYVKCKESGKTKDEFLQQASKIEGVYVPSLYDVNYNSDGTICSLLPKNGAPLKIKKRIIKNLDKSYYPKQFVVPFIDVVHDRVMEEIFRGCIRGCRFCQAGFIYRPVREKSPKTINEQSHALCLSTGYDEISLSSLSSSDYTKLDELLDEMTAWTTKEKVNISLPSLRVDGFSKKFAKKLQTVRRSSLTFAPEAGTQRLRDVINKNITEQELISTCKKAFESGWSTIKLYFMLGLPTETDEDIEGIGKLAQKIVDTYFNFENRPKHKSVKITVSTSTFVPKPFTPFQWEAQYTVDNILKKQKVLVNSINNRKISCNYHESSTSFLEAIFARGDRKLCSVLECAYKKGCKFDSWSDCFDMEKWLGAFKECNIDPHFYANRKRDFNEILPWDHIDFGVNKQFLITECKKAYSNQTTPNCRESCSNCGATCFKGGLCIEKR